MPKRKAWKESSKATLARVKKEMAKPRVAKSARKKFAKLGPAGYVGEAEMQPAPEVAEIHFGGKLPKK